MSISEPARSDSSRRHPEKRTKRRKRPRSSAPTKLVIIPLDLGEPSPSKTAHDFFRLVRQDDNPGVKTSDFSPIIVYIGHEDYRGQDRLHIMLRIEERTTVQDLRDVAPLALTVRDRLLEFQGPRVSGGETNFFENLCRDKENGGSWLKLAKRINSRVAELLKEWTNYQSEYREASPGFKKMLDFYLWRSQANPYSLDHAKDLLRLMKLSDSEIETLIKDGLEKISRGEPPFVDGYPIDADELRATLRSWKSGKLHRLAKRNIEGDQGTNKPDWKRLAKTRNFSP